MKVIDCWEIDPKTGQLIMKFPVVNFAVPDFQDYTDDNISTAMIMSIDNQPKVYVYWKETNQLIEVDPKKGLSEKFSKTKSLIFICDVD